MFVFQCYSNATYENSLLSGKIQKERKKEKKREKIHILWDCSGNSKPKLRSKRTLRSGWRRKIEILDLAEILISRVYGFLDSREK